MFKRWLALLLSIQFALPPAWAGDAEPGPAIQLEDVLGHYGRGELPDLSSSAGERSFLMYLKTYFRGDNSGEITLERIKKTHEILVRHPELTKPQLKEIIWKNVHNGYGIPASLRGTLESISKASGKWKALFLNPHANIGDWLKLKLNGKPIVSEAVFEKLMTQELTAVLSKKDRTSIEVLEAYKIALNQVKQDLGGQAYQRLWQGLAHLTAATEPEIQAAMKSPDGMAALDGVKGFLALRDSLSQTHVALNFDQLNPSTDTEKNPIPSNTTLTKKLAGIEQDTKALVISESFNERVVRALSIAESGFRSCLADDCATNSYFTKAFDPNFLYFTMQEGQGWRGAITVVLGTAFGFATKKVAFVDKIQMVDNADLPGLLESVRRILEEAGHELVLPNDLGDNNGISNQDFTRSFIASMPTFAMQKRRYLRFKPQRVDYDFPNRHSRAYKRLSVRPLLAIAAVPTESFVLHEPEKVNQKAQQEPVSLWDLIEASFAHKNGSLEDQLRYIDVSEMLNFNNLPIDPDFYVTMDSWIRDPKVNIKLRFRAMAFFLLKDKKRLYSYLPFFSKSEIKNLLQNWAQKQSLNKVATENNLFWRLAAEMGPSVISIKSIWSDARLSNETWALFKDPTILSRIHSRIQLYDSNNYTTQGKAIKFLILLEAYKAAVERDQIDSVRELEPLAIVALEDLLPYKDTLELLVQAIEDPNSPADEALIYKLLTKNIDNLNKIVSKAKLKRSIVPGGLIVALGLFVHAMIGSSFGATLVPVGEIAGAAGLFVTLILRANRFHEVYWDAHRVQRRIQRLQALWDDDLVIVKHRFKEILAERPQTLQKVPALAVNSVTSPPKPLDLPSRSHSLWSRMGGLFQQKAGTVESQIDYIERHRRFINDGQPADPDFDKFIIQAARSDSPPDLRNAAILDLMANDSKKFDSVLADLPDSELNSIFDFLFNKHRSLAKEHNAFWKIYAATEGGIPFNPEVLNGRFSPKLEYPLFLTNERQIFNRIKFLHSSLSQHADTKAYSLAMEFMVVTEALKAAIQKDDKILTGALEAAAEKILLDLLDQLKPLAPKTRDEFSKMFAQSIHDDASPVEEVLIAKILARHLKSLGWKNARSKALSLPSGAAFTATGALSFFALVLSPTFATMSAPAGISLFVCTMGTLIAGVFIATAGAMPSDESKTAVQRYRTLKELWSAQSKELKRLSTASECSCLSAP